MTSTALIVTVTVDRQHWRRRHYFNLASAQRAAERAQARGQHAEVVLCALQPLHVINLPQEVTP